MTRSRYARPRNAEDEFRIDLSLLIGPTSFDGYTDAELEAAWREYGHEINER